MAAKPKTKSQIISLLAEQNNLTKVQVKDFLDSLAAMAYKEAKVGFTIPGLGKLVVMSRKARMGRNPATGESIKIPAKKVVKFRVAKACKDAVVGGKPEVKKPAVKKVAKKTAKKAVKKVIKKK